MPKRVDYSERRAHIVDAVTKIIIRDGFESVSMREIASEAGYAHGALTRYFPNRQSLLTAAFVKVFQDSHNDTLAAVHETRGLESLERMTRAILPFSGAAADTHVVLAFWAQAAQNTELWSIHHENVVMRRELIRRCFEEAREDGELGSHVDIEIAIEEVSARNAGWQMLASLVPEAATDHKLEASLLALIESFRHRTQETTPPEA